MCWNICTASSWESPVSVGLWLSGWYVLESLRYWILSSRSDAPKERPRILKESYITLPIFSGIQSRSGISLLFLRGGGTLLRRGGDLGGGLGGLFWPVELELELEFGFEPELERLGGESGGKALSLPESWFLGLLLLLVQVAGRSGRSAFLSMRHQTKWFQYDSHMTSLIQFLRVPLSSMMTSWTWEKSNFKFFTSRSLLWKCGRPGSRRLSQQAVIIFWAGRCMCSSSEMSP